MKCPVCGVWSEVLDTRAGAQDKIRRRRRCANSHVFPTLEIHATMVNPGAIKRAWHTITARRERWKRDQQIVADPRTAAEIGKSYSLTAKTVHSIRRRMKQKQRA